MHALEITVEQLLHGLYGAEPLPAGKRIRHLGALDESGPPVGVLSVAREREALVGEVFEATLEPILITDAKGRFTDYAAVLPRALRYGHLDRPLFDGCDRGRGYHFNRPLPAADVAAFCRSPRPAERAHCQ